MFRLSLACLSVVVLVSLGFVAESARHPATAIAAMMSNSPNSGFSLHIDADKHFGDAHPDEIAHHWCKNISPNLFECQIYDADGPHARLVGVETIVPASVWKTFSAQEQALWHYHATELKKIHATLPDTPKDKQAGIIASISHTYGKVYILWDPMTSQYPTGHPTVTVLK